MSVIISNTTRGSLPKLPFEQIKNDVLGKRYQLSLSFIGETRGKRINQEARGKTYIPNVLSFPLTEDAGEMYITPSVAKREAKKYDHSYHKHLLFLFIHGLVHLKGFDHGPKMDKLEEKYLNKYSN